MTCQQPISPGSPHQRHIPCRCLWFAAGRIRRVHDLVNIRSLLYRFTLEITVPSRVDVGSFKEELPPPVVNVQVISFDKVIPLNGLELIIQPVAVGREGVGQVK